MCGFAALVALNGATADPAIAQQMAGTLAHRGPDDRGTYTAPSIALGFRRLAILDLARTGHQPFVSDDGRLVLVYNGAIYNFVELRRELQALGHTFRSTGDTEVVLRAYQQWGRDCLPRFNGMWAFLVYDSVRGVLFGSRDRFGVKPLFRYRGDHHVLFASEIKAIRASGLYRGDVDWTLVAELLGRGLHVTSSPNASFFTGIEQVPAGSAFELHPDGRGTQWRYWSLDAECPVPTPDDPPGAFYELFEDAVRLRMRSDVPIGVSLSGGLDSASITSVIAHLRTERAGHPHARPLAAFSYIAPEYDESVFIDATVRQSGAELHLVEIDPVRLWDDIDRVLWYHDEPVHSAAALVGYEVYRHAAAHGVKVVLCGQGADEAIGGYSSFFGDAWCSLLRRGAVGEAWRDIRSYCAAHGGDPRAHFLRAVERSAKWELARLPAYREAARRRYSRPSPLAARWIAPDVLRAMPPRPHAPLTLDGALRGAIEHWPLPLYLRIEDRNSMAHSVEARLPFLDYRLVQLASALPARWKLRGPYNKYVLREAMRGRLPERVRMRVDKMGFPTSIARWVRSELYDPFHDTLSSGVARTRGIYDVDAIRADLERHRRGEVDVANELFNVVQLERWLQMDHVASGARGAAPAQPLAPTTGAA